MSPKPRLIARIVAWSCDAAWAVTAAVVLLTALAMFYAANHFSMTTDTAKLISPNLPWRQIGFWVRRRRVRWRNLAGNPERAQRKRWRSRLGWGWRSVGPLLLYPVVTQ